MYTGLLCTPHSKIGNMESEDSPDTTQIEVLVVAASHDEQMKVFCFENASAI